MAWVCRRFRSCGFDRRRFRATSFILCMDRNRQDARATTAAANVRRTMSAPISARCDNRQRRHWCGSPAQVSAVPLHCIIDGKVLRTTESQLSWNVRCHRSSTRCEHRSSDWPTAVSTHQIDQTLCSGRECKRRRHFKPVRNELIGVAIAEIISRQYWQSRLGNLRL